MDRSLFSERRPRTLRFPRFDKCWATYYPVVHNRIAQASAAPDGADGNGEAGESPALSRNCNSLPAGKSQVARLCKHELTLAAWGAVHGARPHPTFLPEQGGVFVSAACFPAGERLGRTIEYSESLRPVRSVDRLGECNSTHQEAGRA